MYEDWTLRDWLEGMIHSLAIISLMLLFIQFPIMAKQQYHKQKAEEVWDNLTKPPEYDMSIQGQIFNIHNTEKNTFYNLKFTCDEIEDITFVIKTKNNSIFEFPLTEACEKVLE